MNAMSANVHGFVPAQLESAPVLVWLGQADGRALWPREPLRLSYAIGSTSDTRCQAEEYCLQLSEQFGVLREISAELYLERREEYVKGNTPGDKGAQNRARSEISEYLHYCYGYDHTPYDDFTPLVSEFMDTHSVVHNPDRSMGGSPEFAVSPSGLPLMRNRAVNSSIGAQHQQNVAISDLAARHAVANGHGDLPLNIHIVLHYDPTLRPRMRNQSPSIIPGSAPPSPYSQPRGSAEQAIEAFLNRNGPRRPSLAVQISLQSTASPRLRTPREVLEGIDSRLAVLRGSQPQQRRTGPTPHPPARGPGLGRS